MSEGVGIEEDCWCGCFFFQAEGGIRDVERSRGLGDVYRGQVLHQKDVKTPRTGVPVQSSIGSSRHVDVVRRVHRYSSPIFIYIGSQLLSPLFDSTGVDEE